MAAGAAPVMMLDEHFRSDPHLIDFVARRLYGGSLKVATRTPATDTNDCVNVIRIDVGHIGSEPAPATDSGVARRAGDAEISVVVRQLQRLLAEGERSVGVVTPLRAHAEAIERSVLSSLSTTEIELLNLRIGTAHQFQGAERDTMIVSLGVAPSAAPGTWTFVQDEHLLAVLLTRARKRMIVVLAADPPAPGLLADYLAQADAPPAPPGPAGPSTAWAAAIAADLSSAGRSATLAYPTGRHIIDIAVAADPRPAAVDCTVHPDGPASRRATPRAGTCRMADHRSVPPVHGRARQPGHRRVRVPRQRRRRRPRWTRPWTGGHRDRTPWHPRQRTPGLITGSFVRLIDGLISGLIVGLIREIGSLRRVEP